MIERQVKYFFRGFEIVRAGSETLSLVVGRETIPLDETTLLELLEFLRTGQVQW